MTDRRFSIERLESFSSAVLAAQGVPADDAKVVSERLVEADSRGRSGHGLIRLPQYSRRIEAGGYNLNPQIEINRETPTSALIDGDNGLGQLVMTRATSVAIEKAAAQGVGLVGTVRSNHAGAAGIYTAMALEAGLGALYFAVANGNAMPPPGGVEKLLGTNPIAFALPAGNEDPFQLDMATTVVSHGTISVTAQAGEKMPTGWVVDEEGGWITDPSRSDEGFLAPIGGYKGAGLGMMIGLLAGVMTGSAFGKDVVPFRSDHVTPTNTGQLILVFRPDLFMSRGDFESRMDTKLREIRNSRTLSGDPVVLPGERAVNRQRESVQSGVPLPEALVSKLNDLADRLGVAERLEIG